MDTIESIENRRSIRLFKSDDVPKEIVEDILNCGKLAPLQKIDNHGTLRLLKVK